MKHSKGFTLIELIIVVVILGILAAVAIPKFIDLSANSKATAATASVASSLTTANSANYTARKADSTKGVAVENCTDVGGILEGGLPTGYNISSAAVAVDAVVTCTLNGPNSTSATFSATGVP